MHPAGEGAGPQAQGPEEKAGLAGGEHTPAQLKHFGPGKKSPFRYSGNFCWCFSQNEPADAGPREVEEPAGPVPGQRRLHRPQADPLGGLLQPGVTRQLLV